MSSLDEAIRSINKKMGETLVGNSNLKRKNYKRIPFATPTLTSVFRGGLPRTVIEISGAESSGKSTLCYSICAQAQKIFKKEYEDEIAELSAIAKPKKEEANRLSYLKDRGAKKVLYLDNEFSTDDKWLVKNGVHIDDVVWIFPENNTAEQLLQIIEDLIRTDGIGLVVIDSIPAMVSKQIYEKTYEEKTMGGISAVLTVFASKIMQVCHQYGCTLIGINQCREDMSGYHQIKTPGGRAWKHACSIRLVLKRGDLFNENYVKIAGNSDSAYGNYTRVQVIKNKATKPDRRLTSFSISYDYGIDTLNDFFDLCVTNGLIEKGGAWYSLPDNALKWQGKATAMNYFRENKEITDKMMGKLNDIICAD